MMKKHLDFHLIQFLKHEAGVECFDNLPECACLTGSDLKLVPINKPSHFKPKISEMFYHHHCSDLSWKAVFSVSFLIDSLSLYVLKYCRAAAVCSGDRTPLWGTAWAVSFFFSFHFFLWMLWPLLCTRCGFPWSFFLYLRFPHPRHPRYEWFTSRTSALPPQECETW